MDITRTTGRAALKPTGIDRIERAYIRYLAKSDTPLFGLLRTKLGYLLLDQSGCLTLLDQTTRNSWSKRDALSRLTRRSDPSRAITETGLRRIALDRATPRRLSTMLARHLPSGAVYFNIGQTNLSDRVIHAVTSLPRARIVVYLHDTIPLDWPKLQTPNSRLKFKRFFERAERYADLLLCNSQDTKLSICRHAQGLDMEQVQVVLPGLPEMTIGQAPTGPWANQPYFMTIGTIEPRKNIGFLLNIWETLDPQNKPHLLLCGRRGWLNEEVFARLDQNPAHVHELSDLDDPALWALLKASNGLLFPSLAEGFGYPAMEAAHLGVPLVCNPLPAFRNLLGKYPIYATASDSYLWRNNIEQLAQTSRVRGGEQDEIGRFQAPTWQAHFNQLFTLL